MNRSDVFISYRRANKEFAQRLDEAFKNEGMEVWVDWEDIPPGVPDFTVEITEGIEGSETFVPVLSPEYLESPYCMGELDMAIQQHKRIVPIVYKKFDVSKIPGEIGAINWVYFTPHVGEENEFEDAFPILMEALRADYEHVAAHSRYYLRAREWEDANKSRSSLLHGKEIDEAEQWLAASGDKNPTPLNLHTEFILASRAAQRQQQRRLLLGVTFAFILSIGLTILSIILYRQALLAQQAEVAAREEAERQQAEAQSLLWSNYAVQAVADNDTRLAIPLALAANQIENLDPPPSFSQQALAAAAYAPGPRRVFQPDAGRIWATDYSIDEQNVAGATSTGELIQWNVNEPNTPLWRVNAHQGSVWDIEYMPDGESLVSSGADGEVIIWDITNGEEMQRLTGNNSNSIWSIATDVDGRYIIGGSVDGHVYIWQMPTGELIQTLDSQNQHVWTVAFSPDGRYIASGGSDNLIVIWDTADFTLERELDRHIGDIWSIEFSPDSDYLISGGSDNQIIRWEVSSGAISKRYITNGHTDRVLSVSYSPDGETLLSASADHSIILWDVSTAQVIRSYLGHSDVVWDVQRARRNRRFISSSSDGSIILWDIDGGAELRSLNLQKGDVTAANFTPDGQSLVIGTEDRHIIKQEINGNNILEFQRLHTDAINDIAFSEDGRIMLTAADTRVIVWDALFGGLKMELIGHEDEVRAVAIDPVEPYIYSAGSDNKIIRWNSETGEIDLIFEQAHTGTVWDIAVDPAFEEMATASADRSVIIWDIQTGEPLVTREYHTDIVRSVSYNHDGMMLVSGGDDRVVILDIIQEDTSRRFTGHDAPVMSVQFSPDGQFIVSGDSDGVVIIWDLVGNQLRRYESHLDQVTAVAFEPTGQPIVLSASRDGHSILWRADDLNELIAWTQENRDIRQLNCFEQELFQLNLSPQCETDSEVEILEENTIDDTDISTNATTNTDNEA